MNSFRNMWASRPTINECHFQGNSDDDTLALPDDHAAYGAVDVGVDRSYSNNHELRHRRRRRNKYVGFAMVCRIMRYAIVRDWDE